MQSNTIYPPYWLNIYWRLCTTIITGYWRTVQSAEHYSYYWLLECAEYYRALLVAGDCAEHYTIIDGDCAEHYTIIDGDCAEHYYYYWSLEDCAECRALL